jgi:hypothetical protein
MRSFPLLALVVVMAGPLMGCSNGSSLAEIRASAGLPPLADLRTEFRTALRPGDTIADVEAAFKSRGIDASYDRFQNMYHGIIRSKKTAFYAIEIDVKLDAEKRVVSVEVNESYTMP